MSVKGPNYDRTKDRWIVRWRDGDRGRARSFIGEDDARAFAGELRGETYAAGGESFALPDEADSGAVAWSSRLARLADAAISALATGDEALLRRVTACGRVVAQLSTAERHHVEVAELAEQLAEHERWQAEVQGEIDIGAGADGPDEDAGMTGMVQRFLPGGGSIWEQVDDEPN